MSSILEFVFSVSIRPGSRPQNGSSLSFDVWLPGVSRPKLFSIEESMQRPLNSMMRHENCLRVSEVFLEQCFIPSKMLRPACVGLTHFYCCTHLNPESTCFAPSLAWVLEQPAPFYLRSDSTHFGVLPLSLPSWLTLDSILQRGSLPTKPRLTCLLLETDTSDGHSWVQQAARCSAPLVSALTARRWHLDESEGGRLAS